MNALWHNPARYWLIFFLLVNFFFEQDGATNANSRHALLMAMAEDLSFQIDAYSGDTVDWARTPDGHFYSNKAPGPVLVAFPLFKLYDAMTSGRRATRAERDRDRRWRGYSVLKGLSFSLQAIPFAYLTALAVEWLKGLGVSLAAQHLAALALLFGSTASLFMNTFFGHGFAAVCSLAASLAFLRRRAFVLGLSQGLLVLSDYAGVLCVLPILLTLLIPRTERLSFREWRALTLGALAPALFFIFYHTVCFGSPWTLPNKFQNPIFVEAGVGSSRLWGALDLLPQPHVLWELWFGSARGILWTQPWVFVLILGIALTFCRRKDFSEALALKKLWELGLPSLISLGLLLWMNASFNGWHGGNSPGPRYLSVGFPPLALCLGIYFDKAFKAVRLLSWASVLFSTIFSGLVLAIQVPIPFAPLWRYYLMRLLVQGSSTGILRISFFIVLMGMGLWMLHRRLQPISQQ